MHLFEFHYFIHLLTSSLILHGLRNTVLLAVAVWLASLILGFPLALMLQAKPLPVRGIGTVYVWLFRALPPLLLIIFVYEGFPLLIHPLKSFLASPYWSGFIALTLINTAYMAEVYRGSLLGVDDGQREAARALGMNYRQTQTHVVLGQALRIAVPPIGNAFIGTLKDTSLVSVISFVELTLAAQEIYQVNFRVLEALSAAAVYYLALATAFTLLQKVVERSLDVERRGRKVTSSRSGGRASDIGKLGRSLSLRRSKASALESNAPQRTGAPVQVRGLTKSFGSTEVLKGIDLDVAAGEVVVLMGPSGSGKTTLLRCLNQLEHFQGGTVKVGSHEIGVPKARRSRRAANADQTEVGIVFQRFNLFPNRSALHNVTLAPRIVKNIDNDAAKATAVSLLDQVGLGDRVDYYPAQLSGGQQQRVAIARALALGPEVILFDEPTSALDPELVGEVVEMVRQLGEAGYTLLIVSHEMRFARRVADRVVFMEKGNVVETGTPDQIFDNPEHDRTRSFVEQLA